MLECDGRKGFVGEISFCSLVLKVYCHFVQMGSSRVFFGKGQKYWFCCQDVLLLQVFTVLVP